MAEDLHIPTGQSKKEKYKSLIPQIKALVTGETDLVANQANISAALKEAFDFLWVGFYWVKDDELVLGPFQGPVACTRIQRRRGVCGTAWEEGSTQIVADVDAFPGHIACSSLSKSEIVLPIKNRDGKVVGVLDIDSAELNHFDGEDKKALEAILQLLDPIL